ncbi:MAG TPA: hypothetical protein VF892_16025, partial [Pseudonocardiaceae bacterium]
MAGAVASGVDGGRWSCHGVAGAGSPGRSGLSISVPLAATGGNDRRPPLGGSAQAADGCALPGAQAEAAADDRSEP